jgi:hypothetical protein
MAPWTLERDNLVLADETWHGVGDTMMTQMKPGEYKIIWEDVSGYSIYDPGDSYQYLYDDEAIDFSVTYEPPRGDIHIVVVPDTLSPRWYLDGPPGYDEWGDGAETLADMKPGEYEIDWRDVSGFTAPVGWTATHVHGSDLTFTGIYTPE